MLQEFFLVPLIAFFQIINSFNLHLNYQYKVFVGSWIDHIIYVAAFFSRELDFLFGSKHYLRLLNLLHYAYVILKVLDRSIIHFFTTFRLNKINDRVVLMESICIVLYSKAALLKLF